MHRKPPFKLLAAALLVWVLVAAEALTVAHSLDFDAHLGGEPCKICISVAGLGAGAPAKAVLPALACADAAPKTSTDVPVHALRVQRRSARGPPQVS